MADLFLAYKLFNDALELNLSDLQIARAEARFWLKFIEEERDLLSFAQVIENNQWRTSRSPLAFERGDFRFVTQNARTLINQERYQVAEQDLKNWEFFSYLAPRRYFSNPEPAAAAMNEPLEEKKE